MTQFLMHWKYISNLLLTLVVCIQCLQEIRGRPRLLWSEVREQEAEVWHKTELELWHKTELEARFPDTYEEAYVLLHCACNLCVLMTMSYMNAVREATCKVSIVWILYLCVPRDLRKLPQKPATAQEIHRMVVQVKGGKHKHQPNNIWHL